MTKVSKKLSSLEHYFFSLPALLGRTHSLTLLLFPPPHVFVHVVQSVHSVQMGHLSSLQGSVIFASPVHWSPLVVRTHSLSLVLVPPSQDLVHGLHSVQSVQSGQVLELHSRSSELSPWHKNALSAGSTQFRSRRCLPPPQVAVQVVQSVHSVQTGHCWVLQASSSSASPYI